MRSVLLPLLAFGLACFISKLSFAYESNIQLVQTIQNGETINSQVVSGLNGIYGATISDAGVIYTAGYFSDAIGVFQYDAETKQIAQIQKIQNGVDGNSGLNGVRAFAFSPDQTELYATSFYSETMVVYDVDADGLLTQRQILKEGDIDANGRQIDGMRRFWANGNTNVLTSPDGQYVYVTNNNVGGAIFKRLTDGTFVSVPPNTHLGLAGTRQGVMNRVGDDVYTVTTVYDGIYHYKRNVSTGALSYVNRIVNSSSTPNMLNPFTVKMHPSERFLVLTSTNHDSIIRIDRDTADGTMSYRSALVDGSTDYLGNTVERLDNPLRFNLNPLGNKLITANYSSDSIGLFAYSNEADDFSFEGVLINGETVGANALKNLDAPRGVSFSKTGDFFVVVGHKSDNFYLFEDVDVDADGLFNEWEVEYGFDPYATTDINLDGDEDGLNLLQEQDFGSDPHNADADNDGLNDAEEQAQLTDPNEPDTDEDGLPDGWEVENGLDPTDTVDPTNVNADDDEDGLSLLQEFEANTDPNESDSDDDGVDDGTEVANGTDPNDDTSLPDFDGPVITLNGDADLTTEQSEVTLSGQVSDLLSDVAEVSAVSSQYEGTTYSVTVGNDTWQILLPLKLGTNVVTFTATDTHSNASTLVVTIERTQTSDAVVDLQITRPTNNATVNDTQVLVEGIIISEVIVETPTATITNSSNDDDQVTATVTSTANPTQYQYEAIVNLVEGANNLTVSAQVGEQQLTESLTVTQQPEQQTADMPRLEIFSPTPGAFVANQSFQLIGEAISFLGPVSVKIDGVEKVLDEQQYFAFQELISFEEGETSVTVNIEVSDQLGQTINQDFTFYYDNQEPQITLSAPLAPASSAINFVTSHPYVLSGTVTDTNLASFRINNQNVTLQPLGEGSYYFSVNIGLSANADTHVTIQARDYSQLETTQNYVLHLDSSITANIVAPKNNAQLINHGQDIPLQIIASLEGITGSETVTASLLDEQQQSVASGNLAIAGSLAAGVLQVPAQAASYKILVSVSNGVDVITETESAISVIDPEVLELKVARLEPARGDTNIKPNEPIAIYFNKPLELRPTQEGNGIFDPDTDRQISVQISETANGFTYINRDEPGTSALFAKGYQLEKVNRNFQPVPGGLELLTGGMVAMFYPSQNFAYNADVFVNVKADDDELVRSNYKTRPLPTFLEGGVFDQAGNPVKDVTVTIKELNRTTTTNKDGAYIFGLGDSVAKNIQSGRYELIVNGNMENQHYGTVSTWINVEGGSRNEMPSITLNILNPEIGFSYLKSNMQNVINGSMMNLDLTNTVLNFPNNRDRGAVHAQFSLFGSYGYGGHPAITPLWMYTIEPKGIDVLSVNDENGIPMDFEIPAYEGGYENSPEGAYVLMIGVDKATKTLKPIGVGKIENHRMVSLRNEGIELLDAFGFVWLDALQTELKQYAENQISSIELSAKIRDAVVNPNAQGTGAAQ